jgi:hypothetical protein
LALAVLIDKSILFGKLCDFAADIQCSGVTGCAKDARSAPDMIVVGLTAHSQALCCCGRNKKTTDIGGFFVRFLIEFARVLFIFPELMVGDHH